MKNRFLPYGYCMINGIVETSPPEATIVCEIFDAYRGGSSFKELAEQLTIRQAAYLPGVCAWNKNRVARLLSDRRYLGTDGYPAIVKEAVFSEVQHIREGRSTQAKRSFPESITEAVVPIFCGKCGAMAVYRRDHRTTYQKKYICTNPNCLKDYLISDEAMAGLLSRMLHGVQVEEPVASSRVDSLEIRKLEREISRLMDTQDFDLERVKELIFQLAQEKYKTVASGRYLHDTVRMNLAQMDSSLYFTRRQIMGIVKRITLLDDSSIRITLLNDQEVGGEMDGKQ